MYACMSAHAREESFCIKKATFPFQIEGQSAFFVKKKGLLNLFLHFLL